MLLVPLCSSSIVVDVVRVSVDYVLVALARELESKTGVHKK